MPTAEECRAHSAEYRRLGDEAADVSPQRATLLMNISRSWTALVNQFDRLTAFLEEESKPSVGRQRPLGWGVRLTEHRVHFSMFE
jgi:hypothetical protein